MKSQVLEKINEMFAYGQSNFVIVASKAPRF